VPKLAPQREVLAPLSAAHTPTPRMPSARTDALPSSICAPAAMFVMP
jgi:hypothetical protein